MSAFVTKFVDTSQCDNVLTEQSYNVIKLNHGHINKALMSSNTCFGGHSTDVRQSTSEGRNNGQGNQGRTQ